MVLALGVAAIMPTTLVDRSLGQPREEARPDRDVTVFGLRAEPGSSKVDPMLSPYARPLRKLLPDHGLTLLGAQSGRLTSNESLSCELDGGRSLKVTLKAPLEDGKVHLCVQLLDDDRPRPVFITEVRTPAGQLVFLDKVQGDSDNRLLIGVGAR
jgi:hypothetical protein